MSGRLVVDSIMTADGEVVPLGPVDKDGHRVPLDTRELYGEDGKCLTGRCFLHFPFTNEWFIEETLSRSRFDVSELHLNAVDDVEVLGCCHEIADAMTTLETVAMVAALVPSFLGGED